MDVFVCWDGDHIGRRVGRAVLADDVGEVRRVDQAINAGNDLWRSFALRVGGNIIEIGGDEGRIQIPASSLSELEGISRQYAGVVGATVAVGVAMKMSESAKALLIAKLRGGNQITIWDDSMQTEIDAANATPESEKDKLAKEYLGKAQGVAGKENHASFTGTSHGSKAKGTQGDHEEGAVSAKTFTDAEDEAPAGPEGTHAATDFEDQLHGEASKQDQKDQQAAQQQDSHLGEIKQRLVGALQTVRQSMPKIQQISQSAPEVYASLMALTQGLVDLGREVMGSEQNGDLQQGDDTQTPVKKAEELMKAVAGIQPIRRSIEGPGRLSFDYSNHLPQSAQAAGLTMKVTHVAGPTTQEHLVTELMHKGRRVGTVTGYVHHGDKAIEPHSDLLEEFRGKGLGQAMYEATYAHAKNKLGMKSVSGGSHSADAHLLHTRLAQKHGFSYKASPHVDREQIRGGFSHKPYSYTLKDEPEAQINDDEIIGQGRGVIFHHEVLDHDQPLDKAALGAQGGAQAGRQHLELPAGSVMDGRIKVKHADGSMGWKSVRAGMISGQEADAPVLGMNTHPVSSRAPGSK